MGIYEKMEAAMDAKDAAGYLALFDDSFEFVRHQTGTSMSKPEFAELADWFMNGVTVSNPRKIYENDDILVTHMVMDFPDGTREAVMEVMTLKDGKVTRAETGATPLSK